MRAIVHFQRNGPRDGVYLSDTRLLEELVAFLMEDVSTIAAHDEVLVLAENRELGKTIEKVTGVSPLLVDHSMHHLDEHGLCDWAEGLVSMAPKEFREGSVLLLSPFAGQVTAQRVQSFLEKSKSCQALSLEPVAANANPFWLNLVSPLSRYDDWIRDRNATQLPHFFNPSGPFVNMEELQKHVGQVSIYGSQWLPSIYREDRAIMRYCGEKEWEHVVAECGDEELPLLYSLPVNDVSLDEPLRMSSQGGAH